MFSALAVAICLAAVLVCTVISTVLIHYFDTHLSKIIHPMLGQVLVIIIDQVIIWGIYIYMTVLMT